MKKVYLLFLLLLIFPIIASAQEIQTLDYFKTGSCATLKQTCNNCTYINISISVPPDQDYILLNDSMIRTGLTTWIYNFCNTSISGQYIYDTYGDLNGAVETGSVNFFINPIGKLLTEAQAKLYSIFFIISVLLFLGCFSLGLYLPSNNQRDQMSGYIIAVSNLKYLKYFFIAIAYLILMLILYLGYVLSYGYLDLDILGNLFYIGFIGMLVLLLPLFIVGTYMVIANAVRDHKIGEALQRGLRVK